MKLSKTQILFIAFTIVTILSIAATYYKMVVIRDFIIIDDTDEVYEDEE